MDRLRSFGLVVAIGFLLMVSLAVSAAIGGAWRLARSCGRPGCRCSCRPSASCLSLAVTTALFALLFKFLPDVELAWRGCATGALVTAVLFAVGKEVIGLYLGRSSTASSYGAAASVVVLLLWVYYSSQIVLARSGVHTAPCRPRRAAMCLLSRLPKRRRRPARLGRGPGRSPDAGCSVRVRIRAIVRRHDAHRFWPPLLSLCASCLLALPGLADPLVHTYSIVARDPATGEMGVAVQSHWFSVGSIVTWAEAGVGAVATQSFIDPGYGARGLALMRGGISAPGRTRSAREGR